jgi:hypothetical protein
VLPQAPTPSRNIIVVVIVTMMMTIRFRWQQQYSRLSIPHPAATQCPMKEVMRARDRLLALMVVVSVATVAVVEALAAIVVGEGTK